jgi:hypothetical protein
MGMMRIAWNCGALDKDCEETVLKKQIVGWVAALLLISLSGCERGRQQKGPEIPTTYSAVLLDTGQLYYGKLVNPVSNFPELTDVYYIQNATNQETKAVTSILVRRGNEWHGPDRMFLNERHIVLVEPVGANSKVALLIEDDKKAKH